jgi:hypothetical protein
VPHVLSPDSTLIRFDYSLLVATDISVALALPVLSPDSTLIRFDYSLLVGHQQAVASMVRFAKERSC